MLVFSWCSMYQCCISKQFSCIFCINPTQLQSATALSDMDTKTDCYTPAVHGCIGYNVMKILHFQKAVDLQLLHNQTLLFLVCLLFVFVFIFISLFVCLFAVKILNVLYLFITCLCALTYSSEVPHYTEVYDVLDIGKVA